MKERFFNTAGPVKATKHYHIPLIDRMDWDEIKRLIDDERYFIFHAPRQTGKTSTLLAIMAALNQTGEYRAVYANIEAVQAARGNAERGIPAICSIIADSINFYTKDSKITQWFYDNSGRIPVDDLLKQLLSFWSSRPATKRSGQIPTVLLLDEVDALVGDTLISLLRQLRAGYTQRPEAFPQSVILCGVRDVRDYRMEQPGGEIITGGSAFNIKAKSLRMANFTEKETTALILQHTEATGQSFESSIFPELWEDTKGQPWLVNALAHEMVWEDKTARDRTLSIDLERYFAARERLIQSRATHLDQLADKLREDRVRRVIAPLFANIDGDPAFRDSDLGYVEDLGLINRRPQVHISNRIYREILPRELIISTQEGLSHQQAWYLTEDHRLDMPKLLIAFQQFFRENSQSWIERFDYKEAGPQLLLQAFLQRILNGGGRLHREYGLGRKRTDLLMEWPLDQEKGMYGEVQRVVLELKILRGNLETQLPKALVQTLEYADIAGANEAHLIFFNRDNDVKWEDKIWHRQDHHEGRMVNVWGC